MLSAILWRETRTDLRQNAVFCIVKPFSSHGRLTSLDFVDVRDIGLEMHLLSVVCLDHFHVSLIGVALLADEEFFDC